VDWWDWAAVGMGMVPSEAGEVRELAGWGRRDACIPSRLPSSRRVGTEQTGGPDNEYSTRSSDRRSMESRSSWSRVTYMVGSATVGLAEDALAAAAPAAVREAAAALSVGAVARGAETRPRSTAQAACSHRTRTLQESARARSQSQQHSRRSRPRSRRGWHSKRAQSLARSRCAPPHRPQAPLACTCAHPAGGSGHRRPDVCVLRTALLRGSTPSPTHFRRTLGPRSGQCAIGCGARSLWRALSRAWRGQRAVDCTPTSRPRRNDVGTAHC